MDPFERVEGDSVLVPHSIWSPPDPGEALGREFVGLFDTGPLPKAIETPTLQWAYAEVVRRSRAESGPALVAVEIEVQSGKIGIGVLSRDETRFHNEWFAEPRGRVVVYLPVADLADVAAIVIRNVRPGDVASTASVSRLAVFERVDPQAGPFGARDSLAMEDEARALREFDENGLPRLRHKWTELPNPVFGRIQAAEILAKSDNDLNAYYDATFAELRNRVLQGIDTPRAWYLTLYEHAFVGKRVLEVGSGLGLDMLALSRGTREWVCLDITPGSIENIRRVARLRGRNNVSAHVIESVDDLPDIGPVDVIWCNGSMLNAPFAFAARESRSLLKFLPVGGRWVELCYPRERWVAEGALPFHRWGEVTDGLGTPWMEWYDKDKLLRRLEPAKFNTLFSFNYAENTLNWFDLVRIG